jgi:hypothetical protein
MVSDDVKIVLHYTNEEQHMQLLRTATEIVVVAMSPHHDKGNGPTSSLSPYCKVVSNAIQYLEKTLKHAMPREVQQ